MRKTMFTAEHRGFTLLEMTVVLIVLTILTSAAIPTLTRVFLNKAEDKISLDINAVEDGALAYFVKNNSWPTSITPTGVTPPTDLESNGFLPTGWNAVNPFGYSYTTSTSGSVFTVSTQVVNGSQVVIMNQLPASSYSGNIVSSSVPPPGESNSGFGSWQSVNFNTIYQATSDGLLIGSVYLQAGISGTQSSSAEFYTSSTTPPSSNPEAAVPIYNMVAPGSTTRGMFPFCFAVRKGDYYELALTSGYASGVTLEFIPY